jgi:hypothetical protein
MVQAAISQPTSAAATVITVVRIIPARVAIGAVAIAVEVMAAAGAMGEAAGIEGQGLR